MWLGLFAACTRPRRACTGLCAGVCAGYVQGMYGVCAVSPEFSTPSIAHPCSKVARRQRTGGQRGCVCVYACSKYAWVSMATCGCVWVCVGMRGYVGVNAGFVQDMCGNVWACFNMCGASILHIPMVFAFPTLDCFGFLLAFGSYPVYGQHTK